MKAIIISCLNLLAAALFVSCGGDSQIPKIENPAQEPTAVVEKVYKGEMKCVGCEGLFSELTVREAGADIFTYLLNETYNNGEEGMKTLKDSGTFQLMTNQSDFGSDTVYFMKGGKAGDRYYRRLSSDSIELVDSRGKPTGENSMGQFLVIRP